MENKIEGNNKKLLYDNWMDAESVPEEEWMKSRFPDRSDADDAESIRLKELSSWFGSNHYLFGHL